MADRYRSADAYLLGSELITVAIVSKKDLAELCLLFYSSSVASWRVIVSGLSAGVMSRTEPWQISQTMSASCVTHAGTAGGVSGSAKQTAKTYASAM